MAAGVVGPGVGVAVGLGVAVGVGAGVGVGAAVGTGGDFGWPGVVAVGGRSPIARPGGLALLLADVDAVGPRACGGISMNVMTASPITVAANIRNPKSAPLLRDQLTSRGDVTQSVRCHWWVTNERTVHDRGEFVPQPMGDESVGDETAGWSISDDAVTLPWPGRGCGSPPDGYEGVPRLPAKAGSKLVRPASAAYRTRSPRCRRLSFW